MNKLLVSVSCGFLALPAPGFAADFLETPAVYDWTGFHIGPNIGYAFGGDDRVGLRESEDGGPFVSEGDVGTLELHGVFGGGQLGFNVQKGHFVFGAEGDFEISDVDDDLSAALEEGESASAASDVNWFGTARGRAGWALDKVLLYGTGGIAFADIDYRVGLNEGLGESARLANDGTEVGYTLGGGVEYAVDDAWSVKLEYQYLNFGKDKISGGDPDEPGEVLLTVEVPNLHSIRFGVNYRF
jgi:outer membrane immunogenic protein